MGANLEVVDEEEEGGATGMTVLNLPDTEWAKLLRRRSAFYKGTQHDHQGMDWDGRLRQAHGSYFDQRWLDSGDQGWVPSNLAPYGCRRPDSPMPIGRQIVNDFSDGLLGDEMRPKPTVLADPDTEDMLIELLRECEFWSVMLEGRDIAGSCGAVMYSLAVREGIPIIRAHHPANLVVLEWADSVYWEPLHVIEQKLVLKVERHPEKGVVFNPYWRTREWTPREVILYQDVPQDFDSDEMIPEIGRTEHALGKPPLIWHQNTRNTDDPLGIPDYDGAWELMDKIDRQQSQVVKASIANTDPTPVLEAESSGKRALDIGTGKAVRLR